MELYPSAGHVEVLKKSYSYWSAAVARKVVLLKSKKSRDKAAEEKLIVCWYAVCRFILCCV